MLPRLIITGGSGFLGQALALRLRDDHDIVLASRNHEANMRAQARTGCRAIAMDVARVESVRDVFDAERPQLVIHAAASKHVGIAERHPLEAVDVNVIGTQNVVRAALHNGVRTVVGISTDKAAPPTRSTYGLTKALGERTLCAADSPGATRFAVVRFGNLAWSTGSVLPEWERMQRDDGVIITTGPDMRRFFMHVDEAAELTRTALVHVEQLAGKVLSTRLGCVRIRDLLDVWVAERGGTWRIGTRRVGDHDDEWLIGDSEAAFTEEIEVAGLPRLVLSRSAPPEHGLAAGLSTVTAPGLTRDAVAALLRDPR